VKVPSDRDETEASFSMKQCSTDSRAAEKKRLSLKNNEIDCTIYIYKLACNIERASMNP